jgi:hypothetical protein
MSRRKIGSNDLDNTVPTKAVQGVFLTRKTAHGSSGAIAPDEERFSIWHES